VPLKFSLVAILALALLPQSAYRGMAALAATPQNIQTTDRPSDQKVPTMSEREKAGLRGPIKQWTDEQVMPAVKGFPERLFSYTTEYDPDGKILSVSNLNSDGSTWLVAYTYDAQGRLLKTSSGRPGGPTEETIYTYDEKGRLAEIKGNGRSNESMRFEYDDQGRKTRIVTSNAKPTARGAEAAQGMSVSLDRGDLYYPAPAGGTVKTLYDERDQATESQVYDADGQLTTRLVRTYDTEGRLTETKMVMENVEFMLTAEMREQMSAESGAMQELKQQFAQLGGGPQGMFRSSYTYDAEGRVTEKRDHVGASQETVTKISYNEHGDKMEEHSRTSGDPNAPEGIPGNEGALNAPAAGVPEETEVSFIYQYDSFGNWTEQTVLVRSHPHETFTQSSSSHRTITYY
jgi:YD repeat-containing protein